MILWMVLAGHPSQIYVWIENIGGVRTLILLWWGMAGAPALDGTVTSQIPKLFLVMGLALTSQLSASLSKAIQIRVVHQHGTY